jgi:uncharacterized protein (TIGR03083 family)
MYEKNYKPAEPVAALPMIKGMRAELLRILENLSDDEWHAPTVCGSWSVRDVAVHFLGDDVGIISNWRDGDGQYHPIEGWEELVNYINAQNELWVRAGRRLSRRMLIDMLRFTGEQVYEVFAAMNPDELAGPIGWAGSAPTPLWLHIAREFTEYWMHHQHICEAVGVTSLKEARYMKPLVSTFIRAVPVSYEKVSAEEGTMVLVRITGEGESRWHLVRESQGWQLYQESPLAPRARITLDSDTAWRLLTRNKQIEELAPRIIISGDQRLGKVFLRAKAFIG